MLPDMGEDDVFIPANAINGAMHGDRVIARLHKSIPGEKAQKGNHSDY